MGLEVQITGLGFQGTGSNNIKYGPTTTQIGMNHKSSHDKQIKSLEGTQEERKRRKGRKGGREAVLEGRQSTFAGIRV